MSEDQIAQISSAIVEVFDGHAEGGDWCATFVANASEKRWIQVTRDMVNFAYPHDSHPRAFVDALQSVSPVLVVDWDSGRFATVKYPSELSPPQIAALVDELFRNVLGLVDADYFLDATIEKLD